MPTMAQGTSRGVSASYAARGSTPTHAERSTNSPVLVTATGSGPRTVLELLTPRASWPSSAHRGQVDLRQEASWSGPVFLVSAETGSGTEALGQAVMREFEEQIEADQAEQL